MDTSYSQISFNHGGNTSLNYQDSMEGNSSPTQRLNYSKQKQNSGVNNAQRKPSLIYQHYTQNNENTPQRVMSENISNYSISNDYYVNNANQSFNNQNNTHVNSMMDSSFGQRTETILQQTVTIISTPHHRETSLLLFLKTMQEQLQLTDTLDIHNLQPTTAQAH